VLVCLLFFLLLNINWNSFGVWWVTASYSLILSNNVLKTESDTFETVIQAFDYLCGSIDVSWHFHLFKVRLTPTHPYKTDRHVRWYVICSFMSYLIQCETLNLIQLNHYLEKSPIWCPVRFFKDCCLQKKPI
jgi:hypothetical protein